MNEQPKNPIAARRSRTGLYILGGVGILTFLVIICLMLMGPIIGNTFTTINSSLEGIYPGEEYSAPREVVSVEPIPPSTGPVDRLIIRTGGLSLTVDDTLAAQQEIEAIVAEMAGEGAFIVSSNARANSEGQSPDIETVIRVPSERFSEAMDRLAGMAVKVNLRNESAEDVTEEYVDIAARVEALEAARDRLLEIMKNAATTEDLLQAEQQLTQREAEIESLKGRMKYLSESARLSSITISLTPYEPAQPIDTTWRPAETVRRAFDTLVDSLRGFANFLIVFVIAVLPWLLLIGLIWWGAARWVKKVNAKKQVQKSEE